MKRYTAEGYENTVYPTVSYREDPQGDLLMFNEVQPVIKSALHSLKTMARTYHAMMSDKHSGFWNFDQDVIYQNALKDIEALKPLLEKNARHNRKD